MDVDMTNIQLSQAACNLTGINSGDANQFHACIELEGSNLHKDVLQSALVTLGHFKTSYRFKKPDGQLISIEERGMVITDELKRPTGFVCTLTDITLQEKLKDDFQAALAMAKFPLENPSPVFRVDKSGKLLFANKASMDMLQALGISAGIITDKGFSKVLSDTITSGENGKFVKQFSSDQVFVLLLVPQQSSYVNVYTTDITESIRLQDQLQDRLSDLSTILDSTEELVMLVDRELTIRSANRTFLQSISAAFAMDFNEGSSLQQLGKLHFFKDLELHIQNCFQEGSVSKMEVDIHRNASTHESFSIHINPIRRRGTNQISGVCLRIKDITQEKSNLVAIQMQKQFYEQILDNIPADIGIFDKDHRYRYVNPAGIKDKNLRQWIIGKTDYDYCSFRKVDSRIADERQKLFQDVLATRKEKEIESHHVLKNGGVKYMLRKFYPHFENGEFKLMIGYGVDITQLKEAQKQIQSKEERYKTLFESNPMPVLVIDLKGTIVSANSALLRETGYEPTGIVGQNITMLLSDKGKSAFPEWITAFSADPNIKYQKEIKVRNSSGQLLDFEITIKKFDFSSTESQILVVANNISERKQSARMLEESERLNRRLLQELPVSVITMVEGRITHVNNAFSDLIGADPTEVLEKPFIELVHAEDRPLVDHFNFELFTGMSTVDYRIRINTLDKKIKVVDVRESLFDLKSNMVTLALLTDVTDKVAIEERNQEIEQRTKMIIESSLDGIVLTDNQLKIVDWNSKSSKIFKWESQNINGLPLGQFFDKAPNEPSKLLTEGLFEMKGLRSDGSSFPSEIFSARLSSGKRDLLVFYIRDITERIQAQEMVKQAERVEQILNLYNAEIYQLEELVDVFNRMIATFHSICDLCHITVFGVDDDGNISEPIPGVGEAFRLPVWNNNVLTPSLSTEIVVEAKKACSMVIRTGIDNGMEKSDLAVPLMVEGKTFAVVRFETGFTGLFSDGNQGIIKKMMEATAMRVSKIQDDQKVRKLNRDLVQNNAQLQQYSYIVSHNLRAPIANLLGLSRLFNSKNLSDERNIKVIRNIESSAGNIDAILKDLNKILAIKQDISKEKEEVSLDEIIYQVLKSLEREFIEVRPRIDLDLKVTKLTTIRSYITSIFTNLISNAIKYRANERDCVIVIRTYLSSKSIFIEFEDNGMGMDLEKFGDQIFGLYKRYHRHVEGSGMGLHLVKSQVEALGGKIEVDSALNKGTQFKIELYND
jgi:PAS domain S-box-containing protein